MADLDLTELMSDPDFVDKVDIRRVTESIDTDTGLPVFAEVPGTIFCSMQPARGELARMLPEGFRSDDSVIVFYKGRLTPASPAEPGRSADVLLWKGCRYRIELIPEDYQNWGPGWCVHIAKREGKRV